MNIAKEATRQFRIQQWAKIIQDKNQSGLTVKEYCEKNNLTRDTYFYWAKIVKEDALRSLPVQRFVELPSAPVPASVTPDPAAVPSELRIQIRDVSVIVTDSTSPALLSRTLGVIRNAL
ncbi:MAG: IS66 family insertion sequence element accessory protein TnpB [Parasporobacterium sp.]|nr:IS66 family insertion sequence element accessory protein TnpB [Parasporobacterium sp.]